MPDQCFTELVWWGGIIQDENSDKACWNTAGKPLEQPITVQDYYIASWKFLQGATMTRIMLESFHKNISLRWYEKEPWSKNVNCLDELVPRFAPLAF